MSIKLLGWNRLLNKWLVRDSEGHTDEPTEFAAYCKCGHLIMESRAAPLLKPAEGAVRRGYIVLSPEVQFEYDVSRRNIPDSFGPS